MLKFYFVQYSSVVEHMFPKPDVVGSSPARRGFLFILSVRNNGVTKS